jgi:peptidoglycan biosynthesis protein MviN/MurJ (putative lipid II flippase)
MAFCGMVINIGLNVVFITVFEWEAIGTAISSLVTQLLTAVAQVLIVQRKFKFRVNWRLLTTLVVFATGVIALADFCYEYVYQPGKLGWVTGFIIYCAGSVAWAFATRLISVKGMFRILKYG